MPGAFASEGVYLLRSATANGTAQVSGVSAYGLGATADARYCDGPKWLVVESSGHSATVDLLAFWEQTSPRPLSYSALNVAQNGTASAQITGYFPYFVGRVLSAFSGTTTATINMWLGGGQ